MPHIGAEMSIEVLNKQQKKRRVKPLQQFITGLSVI